MSDDKCPLTLLVVDDRDLVRNSIVRVLRLHFVTVFGAGTPAQAEALLESEKPPLLLCDYWLGHGHPPATQLIRRWRGDYPWLQRVALMTGTEPSAVLGTDGIDAVFQKPLEPGQLVAFFTQSGQPS